MLDEDNVELLDTLLPMFVKSSSCEGKNRRPPISLSAST